MRRPFAQLVSASLAVLTLSACTGVDELFALEYPEGQGESRILSIATPDGIELMAFDASTDPEPIVRVLDDQSAVLEVVFYDEPLERLGIAPGPVVPVNAGGHFLPQSWTEIFRAELSSEGLDGWMSAEKMSARLSEFRLPGQEFTPCPNVERRGFVLNPGRGTMVAPDPTRSDTALVFTLASAGLVYRLGVTTGEVMELPLLGLPDDRTPAARFVDSSGGLWFAATRIYRADVSDTQLSLEEVEGSILDDIVDTGTGTVSTVYDALHVSLAGGTPEILALDTRGRLWRLAAGSRELVYAFNEENDIIKSPGGLVEGAPGELFVSSARSPTVLHFVDGQLDIEDAGEGMIELAYHPTFGLIGGGDGGRLIFRDDGQYNVVPTGVGFVIRLLAPYSDTGFLFGGGNGLLAAYAEDQACPPFKTTHGGLDSIAKIGDVFVVSGDSAVEAPENAFVLELD